MPMTPHDLTNELGIATDRLLIQLRMWGCPMNGPHSRIPDPIVKRLRDHFPVYVEEPASAVRRPVGPVGPARREHSTVLSVLDETTRQALALLEIPNLLPGRTDDVDQLDLRKFREGLGMTVEKAAAVVAVSVGHLQAVERGAGSAEDVRRIMVGYSIHLAARWASDALRLHAPNFEHGDETITYPPPALTTAPSTRRPTTRSVRARSGQRSIPR